jgi:hypothetical protein
LSWEEEKEAVKNENRKEKKKKKKKEKYSFLLGELQQEDLTRGFLETLDSLIAGTSENLDRSESKKIFQEIASNPLHKIFVVYA